MNDLILSQMRQRLEILYQMVDELERGGGGGGGDDSYTKAQTDALLALKADKSSTYTKSEVNTALSNKANTRAVTEIFTTYNISISEGQSLSSTLTDWLRLHKPINLNGNEYYFAEESGVDYIYKAIDEAGLLPRFSTVQIMKAGLTVHFYQIDVDTTPTEDSLDLITSGAVYSALDEQNTIIATKVSMDDVYGTGKVIPDNSDLNDYRTPGKFGVSSSSHTATIANVPETGSGFTLLVMGLNDATSYVRQTYIKSNRPGYYYVRHYTSGSWSNWYKFEGTEVS